MTTNRSAEDPIATLDRLVADQASEITDEESWESYAQIEDERDVSQAALRLVDQLTSAIGREVQLRIRHDGGTDIGGVLVAVGEEWLRVREPGADYAISLSEVVSVVGVPLGAVGDADAGVARRESWASLLRDLRSSASSRSTQILTTDGSLYGGRIGVVGADFLTLERRHGVDGCYEGEVATIPSSAVSLVTVRR